MFTPSEEAICADFLFIFGGSWQARWGGKGPRRTFEPLELVGEVYESPLLRNKLVDTAGIEPATGRL